MVGTTAKLELVEEFNAVIEELYRVTEGDDGFSMSVYLHQSINTYADDDTMRRLIDAAKEATKHRRSLRENRAEGS